MTLDQAERIADLVIKRDAAYAQYVARLKHNMSEQANIFMRAYNVLSGEVLRLLAEHDE